MLLRNHKDKAAEDLRSTFKMSDAKYDLLPDIASYLTSLCVRARARAEHMFKDVHARNSRTRMFALFYNSAVLCRMWYLLIRSLSQQRNWKGLQKLCESKRTSPVGYEVATVAVSPPRPAQVCSVPASLVSSLLRSLLRMRASSSSSGRKPSCT
jgi:hypothetical protein